MFGINTEILLWGIVAFASILLEIATVQLISIWFTIGSIAALILSLLDVSFKIQIVVFVFVSVLLLLIFYPLVCKSLKNKKQNLNANSCVGQVGVVKETIDNLNNKGLVSVNGVIWSAKSVDDEVIEQGQEVLIKEIKGVKTLVEKI